MLEQESMEIRTVPVQSRRRYFDLLLLADEQESMVNRYIDKGDMFVVSTDGTDVGEAVVMPLGHGVLELKNIAISPEFQRHGYGKLLIEQILSYYGNGCAVMLVGTGDSRMTVSFYESCGFTYSHRVPDFFIDNYDHPIIECGVRLIDMVYFKRINHDSALLENSFFLRPALKTDVESLRFLFMETVKCVNFGDYTREEVDDWASCGMDLSHWEQLLADADYFIVAEHPLAGMVGFASMTDDCEYLHSLFVSKDYQHIGIATALLQAVERHANEKGRKHIHTEASITARPFFEHKGYGVEKAQMAKANRLYMRNYVMSKQL